MTTTVAVDHEADRRMPRRLLIFSTGSLGDTLLVVPAVRVLREHFPTAELVLLCDVQAGSNYVLAKDILASGGLVNRSITYVIRSGRGGWIFNLIRKLSLLATLRRGGFDTLAYCVEAYQGDRRVERDRRFFRLAGIRRFIGMDGLERRPLSQGLRIERVTNRADELLNRLAASGIPIPSTGHGVLDLNLQPEELAIFEEWRSALPPDGGRPWVGIGPGSKMPAKVWPSERFQVLVQRLIDEFDIWPVVFGGPEDAALGERLVRSWGRGHVAAGALGVRVSAGGLGHCRLYVGNDTGTMHLAAAAAIPCVAIFSSRAPPGRWDPYGGCHHVLRTEIDCAGCRLIACIERDMACLMRISVDHVHQACSDVLSSAGPAMQEDC